MERRNIPDPGFAGDDGGADPRVAAALARWAEDPAAEPEAVAALAGSRLMVPVVALLGESETAPDGLRREKTSDMAVPTIQAPDGRRALPAFTSLDSLARWRANARPVPVPARQAVLAAYTEQADTLLVDPAGPVPYQLTGAPMRAVAEGRPYLPPARDPDVLAAVRDAVEREPVIARGYLRPGRDTDVVVALVPDPAAGEGVVREATRRIAAALAGADVLRTRLVRGIDLALLPAAAEVAEEPFLRR